MCFLAIKYQMFQVMLLPQHIGREIVFHPDPSVPLSDLSNQFDITEIATTSDEVLYFAQVRDDIKI